MSQSQVDALQKVVDFVRNENLTNGGTRMVVVIMLEPNGQIHPEDGRLGVNLSIGGNEITQEGTNNILKLALMASNDPDQDRTVQIIT